jgi:hypothetical protein
MARSSPRDRQRERLTPHVGGHLRRSYKNAGSAAGVECDKSRATYDEHEKTANVSRKSSVIRSRTMETRAVTLTVRQDGSQLIRIMGFKCFSDDYKPDTSHRILLHRGVHTACRVKATQPSGSLATTRPVPSAHLSLMPRSRMRGALVPHSLNGFVSGCLLHAHTFLLTLP